jgi:hypothetical protein
MLTAQCLCFSTYLTLTMLLYYCFLIGEKKKTDSFRFFFSCTCRIRHALLADLNEKPGFDSLNMAYYLLCGQELAVMYYDPVGKRVDEIFCIGVISDCKSVTLS